MSVETWEQLPKNQIDPELIVEAIARMIAEHEADPEAHTGENESLQAHRQNEVIDHPAGSVVPDKYSFSYSVYSNFFSVASSYNYSGEVSQSGGGSISATSRNTVTSSYIAPLVSFLEGIDFPTIGFCVDFAFEWYYSRATSYSTYLIVGDDYAGFGLVINESGCRAFVVNDGSYTYSSYFSVPNNVVHYCRIFIQKDTRDVLFYIDSVLVATISDVSDIGDLGYTIYLSSNFSSGLLNSVVRITLYNIKISVG